jgi:NAD(P)-dependent dehydrogenase (short-subunit alcohol dehydrogenase family)
MKDESLKGRVILVTGSTDGIGKETAFELARRGATVVLHGKHLGRCQQVLSECVRASGNRDLGCFAADLSSLDEVRRLGEEIVRQYSRLDVLINNAGVFMTDRVLTGDGFENTFAVNHLAPFLLTHLLLDLLKTSAPSRVVTVSSVAHQRGQLDFQNLQGEKRFTGYGAYSLSKLANVLFSGELAERLEGTGVTANCLHPGVIGTKLLRQGFGSMSGSSVKDGARTLVFLAADPSVARVTGKYFVKNREEAPSPVASDASLRKQFWDISARLCGLA